MIINVQKILIFFSFFFLLSAEINPVKFSLSQQSVYGADERFIMGIWPTWETWRSSNKIKELKEKWGFNFIVIFPDSSILANAEEHYDRKNIISLFLHDILYNSNLFDDLYGYYLDEPVTVSYEEEQLTGAPLWVRNFDNSKYITGDYKRGSALVNYVDAYADIVMFTSYKQWNRFLFWWIPGDLDQRSSWDDMKNIFGDKFSLTWVSAQKDIGEFDRLLLHAKKIGLKGVFLYSHEQEPDAKIFTEFCDAAVKAGYMKRK